MARAEARKAEEAVRQRRLRDAVVLCLDHLIAVGYTDAAEKLATQSGIGIDAYEVCDNVSLIQVITDFESWQELKYGTIPVLSKAKAKGGLDRTKPLPPLPASKTYASPPPAAGSKGEVPTSKSAEVDVARLLKPVPASLRAEYGELAQVITREIFLEDTGVRWGDIVGLEETKRVLREAVVLPLRFPDLFKANRLLRGGCRGCLLHGPPGCAKTMLAKAVASEGTTFFNISCSTLISKWRGESEKLIRILFELARAHAPSTVFIDELDAVLSRRSGEEHEATRRMKTEFLIQMDGLASSDAFVFVLAASNFPFDLDPALLRRLEKRILVPLPDSASREAILRLNLDAGIADVSRINFGELAARTDRYSGSDLRLICKEAAMCPLRRLLADLEQKHGPGFLDRVAAADLKLGKITASDVETAMKRTSPSDAYDMRKYEEWQRKYGVW